MSWRYFVRPRTVVLFLLWSLPILVYTAAGIFALYQTGWFYWIMWTLPPLWLTAWLVGHLWKPATLHQTAINQPLTAPDFWTPHDVAAIAIVQQFRNEVEDVDSEIIADFNRYVADAQVLALRLAKHYHADKGNSLLHPLTLVEILSVIHLAVEDLEQWVLENVPGSDLATIGQLQRIPGYIKKLDVAQKVIFIASSVMNPAKLFAYPLWRKSGRVAFELQNELIRAYYQRYLRQLGYYLIEMYSGRLQGGSENYRIRFGPLATALHTADGDTDLLKRLEDVGTTIAVMGQVKAGKSSLINALMQGKVATTSILPETREVTRYRFSLSGSSSVMTLLDTPGYSEADVTRHHKKEIQIAAESADIVLLVMAANVSARDADLQAVRGLEEYYRDKKQLKPPLIIGVVTHIDLLRPVRDWDPPYDWRNPNSPKEQSIAEAVSYLQELFGASIAGYACVHTGDVHGPDASIAEELIPQLVEHLDQGHAAAILKAYYKQLGQERFKKLARQVIGLVQSIR